MAILSIAIPQSARRLAVPSAPPSALLHQQQNATSHVNQHNLPANNGLATQHLPHSAIAGIPGTAPVSAIATPALPGVPSMQQLHEISAALSGLASLEDLLTALRAK